MSRLFNRHVEVFSSIFVTICTVQYLVVIKLSKNWLNNKRSIATIIAGTGVSEPESDILSDPQGIFVGSNLDLYVADHNNHRIQLFRLNERNGTTVVETQSLTTPTIQLSHPTGVVLDGDQHIFIVDRDHHRIVASNEYGFRCIFSCTGWGGGSTGLIFPVSLSFDSYGNIYVSDHDNPRIQKIHFSTQSCVLTISYNQPKFTSNTTWNPNRTTFAREDTVDEYPYGIFVNSNNAIYVPNRQTGQIQIWDNDTSINPSRTISGDSSDLHSIFVTSNGDIYVDNGKVKKRVDKWMTIMFVQSTCYGFFVDTYQNLYCSIHKYHRVEKKWLNDTTNISTIVAGTGTQGSASDMLDSPVGIFVDINLDLYVADFENNRIQLFAFEQRNGVTIAGQGSIQETIDLFRPTGIILDGVGYLFIADQNNHRIVRSNEYGFHCILGCSGNDSSSNLFNYPTSISFDTYGNIYIIDKNNHRVQKFVKNDFCGTACPRNATHQ